MAVGNRSSRCRGYFLAPWIDGSTNDLVASDNWIFSKEDSYLQALEHKIAGSRETALRRLIGAFNRKPMNAFVLERHQTLFRGFAGILEREDATSSELVLACRALGLLALTMAEEVSLGLDSLIKQTSSLLRQQAQGESTRPACAALEAIAVLAVAGMHTGDLDIEAEDTSWLDWLWSIGLQKQGDAEEAASVAAAGLSAWTMLLTTLAPHRIAHHRQQRGSQLISMAFQKQPVQSASITASHALAFLAEASPPDATGMDGGSSAGLPSGSEPGLEPEPTEYVLLHGGGTKLVIRTWCQTVQFNFLRDYLGAGLAHHMQHSLLLHHIFDFVPKKIEPKKQLSPPVAFEEQNDAVVMRKTRSACRRTNELTERAQTRVRNNGRARKQETLYIGGNW